MSVWQKHNSNTKAIRTKRLLSFPLHLNPHIIALISTNLLGIFVILKNLNLKPEIRKAVLLSNNEGPKMEYHSAQTGPFPTSFGI